MLVPQNLLPGVLSGAITVLFRDAPEGSRYPMRTGEQNVVAVSGKGNTCNRHFGVSNVQRCYRKYLGDLTLDDVIHAGYQSLDEFREEWQQHKQWSDTDRIYVIEFEMLLLKRPGRQYLKELGIKAPKFER